MMVMYLWRYGSVLEGWQFFIRTFNKIVESERMPEEWRSVLVLIYKNKEDVQNCGN